jgi:formiminotetrahydrofolate cyclodeaminase
MGVDLKARGVAQVSMNLTDYEQTPIHRVFELVKREAERYGVAIAGSEIVGLIPQKALEMASDYYLQVENFRPELIFENRLATILAEQKDLATLPVSAFVAAVANRSSVPGGGSVAALAGALAAALGKMVAGFSIGKKGAEAVQSQLNEQMQLCEKCLSSLQSAIQLDSTAYAGVEAALRLPKGTDTEKAERSAKLQEALKHATQVPLQVAETALALLKTFKALEPISNPNLLSDLNTACWMAFAAVKSALENMHINLKSIKDATFAAEIKDQLQAINSSLEELNP